MKKRSWKTTLGGSLSAAGIVLFGFPMATGVSGVEIPKNLLVGCMVAGVALNAVGAFCTGLFGRDNDKTSEDVGVDEGTKTMKRLAEDNKPKE